jgi:DHA1 family bicyclomycin/chloramphenicol resistance-like MFS transporter
LIGAKLTNKYPLQTVILIGICIAMMGVIVMFIALLTKMPILFSIFIPTIIIYFGLCFVLANASSIAMSRSNDKSHAAAVMSFINMGTATVVVLCMGIFTLNTILLPTVYWMLSIAMIGTYKWLH